jgi:hypothetical protein
VSTNSDIYYLFCNDWVIFLFIVCWLMVLFNFYFFLLLVIFTIYCVMTDNDIYYLFCVDWWRYLLFIVHCLIVIFKHKTMTDCHQTKLNINFSLTRRGKNANFWLCEIQEMKSNTGNFQNFTHIYTCTHRTNLT